jgi:hypothetical protein
MGFAEIQLAVLATATVAIRAPVVRPADVAAGDVHPN